LKPRRSKRSSDSWRVKVIKLEALRVIEELSALFPGWIPIDTAESWSTRLAKIPGVTLADGLRASRAMANWVSSRDGLTYAELRSSTVRAMEDRLALEREDEETQDDEKPMDPVRTRAWLNLVWDIYDGRKVYPGKRGANSCPTEAERRWYMAEVDREERRLREMR